jgi:hypothetical protein
LISVPLRFVLLLLLLPLTSWSAELSGRVVRVSDGDTLVLLDASNTQHKIRLAGIDCAERKQPFGQRAKQATELIQAATGLAKETGLLPVKARGPLACNAGPVSREKTPWKGEQNV